MVHIELLITRTGSSIPESRFTTGRRSSRALKSRRFKETSPPPIANPWKPNLGRRSFPPNHPKEASLGRQSSIRHEAEPPLLPLLRVQETHPRTKQRRTRVENTRKMRAIFLLLALILLSCHAPAPALALPPRPPVRCAAGGGCVLSNAYGAWSSDRANCVPGVGAGGGRGRGAPAPPAPASRSSAASRTPSPSSPAPAAAGTRAPC